MSHALPFVFGVAWATVTAALIWLGQKRCSLPLTVTGLTLFIAFFAYAWFA